MHASRWRALVVGSLLGLSACGEAPPEEGQETDGASETDPSTATDSGPPTTGEETGSGSATSAGSDSAAGDDAIDALGMAYCAKLFSCCDGAELAEELKFYDPTPMTEAECVEIIGGLVAYEASSIGDAQAQGRLVFHTDQIAACAEAIESATCGAWDVEGDPFADLVDDPACAAMVEPLSDEGDSCSHDRECITKNCSLVDGMCMPPDQEPGETCDAMLVCNDDAYCDATTEPWMCKVKVGPGEPCPHDDACRSGLCENASTGVPGSCLAICDGM